MNSSNNTQLAAFITATGSAIAAGFVAFGHSSLSSPAQAAFVAGAALVVAVLHNGLLKAPKVTQTMKVTTTTVEEPSAHS